MDITFLGLINCTLLNITELLLCKLREDVVLGPRTLAKPMNTDFFFFLILSNYYCTTFRNLCIVICITLLNEQADLQKQTVAAHKICDFS